jgi:superfamily II DNA or RNA helicase/very-short-patch-repair endonuclease
MGVYPMLLDESCHFLAIDLDGEDWQSDALALITIIKQLNLPVALERSRSGNGGHLWFFFEHSIPAVQARRFGTHLLTEAIELRPEIGLSSYDRMFPNQDTLPKGRFGNLIALPLQKAARDAGNSAFIDEQFEPYPDQWAFLAQIQRISAAKITELVTAAARTNRILPIRMPPSDEFALEPWRAPPSGKAKESQIDTSMLSQLEIVLSNQIFIPKADLPPALRNRILQLAAFQNPEFYKAQAMRLPTFDKPRIIACAESHAEHIALPRGCLDELKTLLRRHKVRYRTKDLRTLGSQIAYKFCGALRPEQIAASEALLPHDNGVLAATTAFGKTVLAAWMIAQRGRSTLILVHRKQLMEQWVERLTEFLNIPEASIGRIGGGRRKLRGQIDVALMQSLVRKDVVDDRIADYGHIIIDECHHLSAHSFERAISQAKGKYVLGLSATVQRKDGHQPIIFMQCGPVRHRVNAKDQAKDRPFQHHVIVRPTAFNASHEPEDNVRMEFQLLYKSLINDEIRNTQIVSDVCQAIQANRNPLILTERTEHLEYLNTQLQAAGLKTVVLQGGLNKTQFTAAMELLNQDRKEPVVVIATGRYVGEGFDCCKLDTLFVTLPVSWQGTVAQYVGRLHRLHDGKKVVQVYDYADLNVPMLARMFDKRCAGYEAVGYSILLPASALPGWPVEVPLPVDPLWKKDYSGSVKRLLQDGVDPPLAQLFVQTATPQSNESRARSASEAFFFKRLETLPETKGQFKLNATLNIPFNQNGTMEVDFLCEAAKLVIELDGSQHLQDEAAWRSDRRKDMRLQMHGYFVLRLLATDLAKRLPTALDQVLSVLTHCQNKQ